jgi:hypothetical protein
MCKISIYAPRANMLTILLYQFTIHASRHLAGAMKKHITASTEKISSLLPNVTWIEIPVSDFSSKILVYSTETSDMHTCHHNFARS